MSAWWFSLLLTTIVACLLKSRSTLRLYFFAQLVSVLSVFVFSHWLAHWYLAAYVVTTVPVLECSVFLVWDAGISNLRADIAIVFGLIVATIGADYAGNWRPGTMITFTEGVLLAVLGMAMALVTVGAPEWAATRSIGALSLALSWYDFAFVRGWQDENNWLPAAICAATFGWIVLRGSVRPVLIRPRP